MADHGQDGGRSASQRPCLRAQIPAMMSSPWSPWYPWSPTRAA